MTTQGRFIPVDMQSLWTMNGLSMGNIDTAFRAWVENGSRFQEQAMKFMSGRLAKDAAAVAELQSCRSPVDAFNVQMAYLSAACADFMDEGQKIAGYFSDVANESLAAAGTEPTSSSSAGAKHRRRPGSAH